LKVPLLAILIGALCFFTLKGYLLWGSLAALVVLAMALGTLQHRAGTFGRSALIGALVLNTCFIGVQNLASAQAKRMLAEILQKKDPASKVLDTSMSSFPTNPLCWTFVSVESNERAGAYRLRRGLLTLVPSILTVDQCPLSLAESPLQTEGNGAIAFSADREGGLEKLRKLKTENCHFEAWLRFARAPAVTGMEASDLRFGLNPEKNFTTINFEEFENRECSSFIPGWVFPRSDLLTPPAAQTRSLR
jgi:inner membrane protein